MFTVPKGSEYYISSRSMVSNQIIIKKMCLVTKNPEQTAKEDITCYKVVFLEDNNHDPILDRAWLKVEKKKLSFNKQYSFVDYLRDNKNRSQGTASAVGSL